MNIRALILAWLIMLSGCQAYNDSINDFLYGVSKQEVAIEDSVFEVQAYPEVKFHQHAARKLFDRPQNVILHGDTPSVLCDKEAGSGTKNKRINERINERVTGLKYKGYIGRGNNRVAIIVRPDNQVVGLRMGEPLGADSGEVVEISDDYVSLRLSTVAESRCWNNTVIRLTIDGERYDDFD